MHFVTFFLSAVVVTGTAYGQANIYVGLKRPLSAAEFERPGRVLTIGYGRRTDEQHCADQLRMKLQGRVELVPYAGRAPAVADLLGGQLDAICSAPDRGFTSHLNARTLVVIATLGPGGELRPPPLTPPIAEAPKEDSKAGKGMVMAPNSRPRYEEVQDSKYGTVVRDTERRLEFSKCLVGMTTNGLGQPCEGKPQKATWTQANNFAKSLGGGWQLAPLSEIALYHKHNLDMELLFNRVGGGWWSGTPSDHPNAYWAFGIIGVPVHIDTMQVFLLARRY